MKPQLRVVTNEPVVLFAHDPTRRGYGVLYRRGEANYCPGCGRSHWYVGKALAECAFCACAVPLEGAVL